MVRPSMYTPALRCATKVVATTPRSPPPGFWFPGMQRARDARPTSSLSTLSGPTGKDSSTAIGQGLLSAAAYLKAIGHGQSSPPSPPPSSPPRPALKGILKGSSVRHGGLSRVHFGASSVRTVSRWIIRKKHVFQRTPRKKKVQVVEPPVQEIELPPVVDEPTQPECEDHSEPSHKSLEEVASQPNSTVRPPTVRGAIGVLVLSFGVSYLLSKLF
ncbi:hypothetical protein N7540_011873 [Penicillium herquei]|nr:hypothetical protein N7540_011873 [Penicillium herquei]